MALKIFKKIGTKDKDLERVQENIDGPLRELLSKQILDGILLEGITLVNAQTNLVNHLLGRAYRGFFIVRLSAGVSIWDSSSDRPQDFLVLNTSANCTISLWVF